MSKKDKTYTKYIIFINKIDFLKRKLYNVINNYNTI